MALAQLLSNPCATRVSPRRFRARPRLRADAGLEARIDPLGRPAGSAANTVVNQATRTDGRHHRENVKRPSLAVRTSLTGTPDTSSRTAASGTADPDESSTTPSIGGTPSAAPAPRRRSPRKRTFMGWDCPPSRTRTVMAFPGRRCHHAEREVAPQPPGPRQGEVGCELSDSGVEIDDRPISLCYSLTVWECSISLVARWRLLVFPALSPRNVPMTHGCGSSRRDSTRIAAETARNHASSREASR